MGRRISKEFLHPSILEGVNNKIGNLDSLETDAKGNMVQAINELVEKLDNSAEIENGKELIANAVGEPLTAEESFDEMSNDINGLLSQFKTNMMNNGITVESSDRFKSLIDKIAEMSESDGGNKGIQFAQGTLSASATVVSSMVIPFSEPLDFTPQYIFVSDFHGYYIQSVMISNICPVSNTEGGTFTITELTNTGFSLNVSSNWCSVNNNTFYAIGVGEEDTTLRDSLASILEEEGVIVTEEDDMASLITKVDEEFKNSLSIIPGTKYTMREGVSYSSISNINSFTEIDNYKFINNGTFTCTMDVRVQGSTSSGSMTGKLELYDNNNELIYTSEEITSTVDEDDSTETLTLDLEVKKGYNIKLLIKTSGLNILSIGLSSGISITFDLN